MSKFGHIMRELGRHLFRNPVMTLASILSLALLLLLFDLFWIGAGTSQKFYTDLLSELRMELYVSETVADSSFAELRGRVGEIRGVAEIKTVSKEAAREELARLVGMDPLVGYDVNPLPRSFVLTIEPDHLTSPAMAEIETQARAHSEITDVSYSKGWLEGVESSRKIILNIGMVLGALILMAALINSANNIRLASRARAGGFMQTRLLGAGKLFLAAPFLLEGLVLGAVSAAIGWAAIYWGQGQISFTRIEIVYPTLEQIAVFCAANALLGMFAGFVGIKRMLK